MFASTSQDGLHRGLRYGDFVGFNSAWGYWLSARLSNASYIVLIFGALSYF